MDVYNEYVVSWLIFGILVLYHDTAHPLEMNWAT